MSKPCAIVEDGRPIKSVCTRGETTYQVFAVGKHGVTSIVAYEETGQCAHVHYFAIYKGEHLAVRVNGAEVEQVHYSVSPDAEGLPVDAQIKSILTDLLDDEGSKESLDGATARIMALKS